MRPRSMRSPFPLRPLAATCALALATPAFSQTHKVEKPEAVTRAIGVYEWTGDLLHPSAGRLIPVTLFINGELQDAAVFEPQPIPFALLPGNQYILEQAGLPRALFDLRSAGKQPDADIGSVDGWSATGTVLAQTTPTAAKLRPARTLSPLITSKGDIQPQPITTPDDDNKNRTENSPDPDRPTLRRRSTTGANKQPSATSQPDPTATPPDDPDRPTLKRRPADSTPAAASTPADSDAQQRSTAAIAADPDRPTLHRGVPADGGPTADTETKNLAHLAGLPKDLHQLVAVSDAASRPEHDFARPWTDDTERKLITAQLETIARAQLAAWNPNNPNPNSPATSPSAPSTPAATSPTPGKSTPSTPAARRRAALARAAAARKAAAQKAAAASLPLDDEDLRAYTLSYGADPTFVFTAHTPAPAPPVTPVRKPVRNPDSTYVQSSSTSSTATTSAITTSAVPASTGTTAGAVRYITLVAQQDTFGHLQIALSSVTDSAHLDRTPWMRLVGPVDVEASNRASLLFELREQGNRQFALFRVLSGHADSLFTTGTTQ